MPKVLFALHSTYTGDTPFQVWFDLNNSLTQRKRPVFKSRYSQNSQIFVRKTNVFPIQAIAKILFLLHPTYTGYTPFQVWFNLNNFLTQWKKELFLKFFIRETQKLPYEILTFSYKASNNKNSFFSYNLITLVILHTEFGLIWKLPWPDENFSLHKLWQKFFFSYTLPTQVILHNKFGLIWTTR